MKKEFLVRPVSSFTIRFKKEKLMIYKEEHRVLINTVRDFAINEIHPFIEEWEKE